MDAQSIAVKPDDTARIPLQNLNTLEIPPDRFGCSFLFCGSTRAGKTTLINYIYERFFKDYICVMMSHSLKSDAYKRLKKHTLPSDLYHPEVLRDMYEINHATDNHYKFAVILDDLTHIRHDKEYQRLLTIYRNSRMSGIISAQNLVMFDRTARGNMNFVFLGWMNSDTAVEQAIKEYLLSYFPPRLNMAEKIRFYREMTKDYHWFVIDNVNGAFFRTKLTPSQVLI